MKFSELSLYLEKLEKTTSRNSIVEILSELFAKTKSDEIGKMMYLLQGRVAPIYVNLEFGMADKMVLKAILLAYDHSAADVVAAFKKVGDVGLVAEEYAQKLHKIESSLEIKDVFDTLESTACTNGPGSVELKVNKLAELFKSLDSLSVRYIARIPVGSMRLGFSDMTVLDSLSWMLDGNKNHRKVIEAAFNAHPDLGLIATVVKEQGIEGLATVKPAVFNPILMARAERLSSGDEIIQKIGTCAVEPKFDGFRLQAHKKGKEVKLFTRNLEEVTFMYPDVVEGILQQIKADDAIFEGEAIAYDTASGDYLPFQITTQRKRKHGIEEMAQKYPLKMICFDLLYCDGKSMINESYIQRRERLASIIKSGITVTLSEEKVVETGREVDVFFDDAISRGLEGILAKKLDGTYQAGARGWNWIKFKRSYSAHLDDTIDCVVMGYYVGQGKRSAFGIGAFLIGVYDKNQDAYVTVAKIGTGLSDDEWRALYERSNKLSASEKPPLYNVDKILTPDVWVEPEIIVEIKADEISRSTIHTAGRVMKPSKSGEAFTVDIPGYALRFPRLERFRDDKKPEDATSLKEVEEMFNLQGKKQ